MPKSLWILFVRYLLGKVFLKCGLLHLKVGKLFASSYSNHCCAWLINYLSLPRMSFVSMIINCYILPHAFSLWRWSWIYANYHREIFPNASCEWTIGNIYEVDIYWSSLYWHLRLIALSLANKMFWLTSVFLASYGFIPFTWSCLVL